MLIGALPRASGRSDRTEGGIPGARMTPPPTRVVCVAALCEHVFDIGLGKACDLHFGGMTAAMEYDERKFSELLLYAASRLADDPAGGAVKLNKVLYFAEFAHMRRHGRPITGAQYQKLTWGPAPRRLLPVRQRLSDEGSVSLRSEMYRGLVQERFVPLRPADLTLFTPEELDIVDQVVGELYGMSATEASAMSHDEIGWQMVDERETIPFEAAFLRRPVVTEAVRRHGALLAEERRA